MTYFRYESKDKMSVSSKYIRSKNLFLLIVILSIAMVISTLLFFFQQGGVYENYSSLYEEIVISEKCSWLSDENHRKPFTPDKYKRLESQTVLNLMYKLYQEYGIITVIRQGSFLHAYRGVRADRDLDFVTIVPEGTSIDKLYEYLKKLIKESYRPFSPNGIKLRFRPFLLSQLFLYDRSDTLLIYGNTEKKNGIGVDLDILSEELLNDRGYISEFQRVYHGRNPRHFFSSLCLCKLQGETTFCFDKFGKEYLQYVYGSDFMTPRGRGERNEEEYPLANAEQMVFKRFSWFWRTKFGFTLLTQVVNNYVYYVEGRDDGFSIPPYH